MPAAPVWLRRSPSVTTPIGAGAASPRDLLDEHPRIDGLSSELITIELVEAAMADAVRADLDAAVQGAQLCQAPDGEHPGLSDHARGHVHRGGDAGVGHSCAAELEVVQLGEGFEGRQAGIEKDIKQRVPLAGDKFKATVGKETFDRAFREYLIPSIRQRYKR